MLDIDTRLRVARGIAKGETEASIEVFATLKRRSHPGAPPPTISDGWGGIDEAMIEVYGQVPEYRGRGRPPTKKHPQPGWQYLQMVKQRQNGRVVGTVSRVIYGDEKVKSFGWVWVVGGASALILQVSETVALKGSDNLVDVCTGQVETTGNALLVPTLRPHLNNSPARLIGVLKVVEGSEIQLKLNWNRKLFCDSYFILQVFLGGGCLFEIWDVSCVPFVKPVDQIRCCSGVTSHTQVSHHHCHSINVYFFIQRCSDSYGHDAPSKRNNDPFQYQECHQAFVAGAVSY